MFGSSVLDLGIGLIFVFSLVSLVCSEVADRISQWSTVRATHLEQWLRDLVMDGDAALVRRLYDSPMIRSLAPAGKKPESIPAQPLMLALFDAFVPGASGRTTVTELQDAVQAMSDTMPLKRMLLGLLTAADDKIEGLRTNFENWFNTAERMMTAAYQRKMRFFSLIIGFAVAIVLNVDTLAVATSLWRDSTLRTSVVAAAAKHTADSIQANDPVVAREAAQEATRKLAALNLPIGWQLSPLQPKDWVQSEQTLSPGRGFVKLFGWLMTAFAGAQGAPFWFDALRKMTQRK